MDASFDKNSRYIFKKSKYFQVIERSGRKISSVEKKFGNKHDGEIVKVINESQGVVEGSYQVNVTWCEKLNA